jgi:putative FmdB family regulatory protein
MPLYEYLCEAGHRFERIVKFSDPPLESCPCGARVEKLVSTPAFQFKGSGWYITDYAKKGSAAEASSGDSSSDKTADKGASQSADSSASEKKPDSASAAPAASTSKD